MLQQLEATLSDLYKNGLKFGNKNPWIYFLPRATNTSVRARCAAHLMVTLIALKILEICVRWSKHGAEYARIQALRDTASSVDHPSKCRRSCLIPCDACGYLSCCSFFPENVVASAQASSPKCSWASPAEPRCPLSSADYCLVRLCSLSTLTLKFRIARPEPLNFVFGGVKRFIDR